MAIFVDRGAPVQCFFDFFMTAPSKTHTFETLFGFVTSQNALRKYDSLADAPQKVKKHHAIALAALPRAGPKSICSNFITGGNYIDPI